MSKDQDPDDFLPEMSETEKYEVEQMLLDRAFENSYLIITKKTTSTNGSKYKLSISKPTSVSTLIFFLTRL